MSNTPQFRAGQFGPGSIQAENIAENAGVTYEQLDLTGKIQASDMDEDNKVTESLLLLNYPTHPEASTLSLQQNFLLTYEVATGVNTLSQFTSVQTQLTGLPVGNNSTVGALVTEAYNKTQILSQDDYLHINGSPIYGRLTNKRVTTQPTNVTGVTVLYCSSDIVAGPLNYDYGNLTLAWASGFAEDITDDGLYKLSSNIGHYMIVDVTFSSLPSVDQMDELAFTTEYGLGTFYTDESNIELPTATNHAFTIYFPVTRSLHTKSWDVLHTFSQTLTPPAGIPHRHTNGIGAPNITKHSATLDQTNFSIGATPSFVIVLINGLLQDDPEDYIISGSNVVLNTGAAASDKVRIYYWVS